MKLILTRIHSVLIKPCGKWNPGVDGMWSFKWMLVLTLYICAAGLMSRDPWFGEDYFDWSQGAIVLLLSFITVSTIAFEWRLLGRSEGVNLLLQFLMMIPCALFLGRIIGRPDGYTGKAGFLNHAIKATKQALELTGITNLVPRSLQELFSSPGLAVFLVAVCIALSVRNRGTQIGLLLAAFLLPLSTAIAYQPHVSLYFVGGVILLIFGASLQYRDVNKYTRDLVISRRLINVRSEAERKCSIRLVTKATDEGFLTEQSVFEIVRRCYVEEFNVNTELVGDISRTLCDKLIHEHSLLRLNIDCEGRFLLPTECLTKHTSLLSDIALWPRSMILAIIAIAWWLSPIDIIPDAAPIVGTVDDFIILWLGGLPLMRQIASSKNSRYSRLSVDEG